MEFNTSFDKKEMSGIISPSRLESVSPPPGFERVFSKIPDWSIDDCDHWSEGDEDAEDQEFLEEYFKSFENAKLSSDPKNDVFRNNSAPIESKYLSKSFCAS